MDLQKKRCAICGKLFIFGLKPQACVDHEHRDADGGGPMRGLLCGGKTGCNMYIVARYENGAREKLPEEARQLVEAYLQNPPASRLR